MLKVAINGFGRIGRTAFKVAIDKHKDEHIEAVPICNLIVINFRSKPLINTKNKLKRGKSPLALASRINRKFDWMTFIKNQPLK